MARPHQSGFEFFTGTEALLDEQAFNSLDFEDVVMRVFPLKANMNRLRSFCDRYLNLPDSDIAHFAPAAPYVLLQILNYGRMSSPSSNMGWVAQNEVAFNVPLVGRWKEGGKTKSEFAFVAPFIFVDDEWSIATGREVYGWPKVLAQLTPGISPWMKDPRSRRRLMTLETLAMSELYAGQEATRQVLLQIEQEAPQLFGQIPPNTDYLLSPLTRLPKLMLGNLAAAPDFLEGLANLAKASGDPLLTGLLKDVFKGLIKLPPKLYGNTLNLKQFRASKPEVACYQSLVNARMQIKRFNAGGLLGSVDLMRGDPTAGYVILLHRLPSFPIIEALGLEVASEHPSGETTVATLRPLMPCWASLDLHLDLGKRLCWRTEDSTWAPWCSGEKDGSDESELTSALDPKSTAASTAAATGGVPDDDASGTSAPFNTTLGQAAVPVAGPFDFFDAAVRVLPIRAKSRSLAKALPKGLDAELAKVFKDVDGLRGADFKLTPVPGNPEDDSSPFDSWVYLVVSTYGSMSSDADDIGWWAKRELAFAFLVKTEFERGSSDDSDQGGRGSRAGGEREPLYWLYWPYQFADSPIAVTEGREVLGLPTAFAKLARGLDPWIEPGGTDANRTLLQLKTKDFPALGVGAEDIERLVLEIEAVGDESERVVQSSLVQRFIEKHLRQGAAASGTAPLDKPSEGSAYLRGVHFSNLSLKQFRDEEHPNRACFQGLVAFERGIGSLWDTNDTFDLTPMDGRYLVRFHRTSLWDITTALGLKASLTHKDDGTIDAVCEVEEPFEVETDIRSHLPTTLISRSIGTRWQRGSRAATYLLWRLLKAGILKRSDIADQKVLDEIERLDQGGEGAFLVPFGLDRLNALELGSFLNSAINGPLRESSGAELLEEAAPLLGSGSPKAALAAGLAAIDASMSLADRRRELIRAWAAGTVAASSDPELIRIASQIGDALDQPLSRQLVEVARSRISDQQILADFERGLFGIDDMGGRSNRLEALTAALPVELDEPLRSELYEEMSQRIRNPVAKGWSAAVELAESVETFKETLGRVLACEPIPAATTVAVESSQRRLDQMLTLEKVVDDIAALVAGKRD